MGTPLIELKMWNVLAESVTGTSHAVRGAPCQDAHRTMIVNRAGETILIMAVADGAGSASFAASGSTLICEELIRLVSQCLRDGMIVSKIDRQTMVDWFTKARDALVAEAQFRLCSQREMACTALVAVIGEYASAFSQLGDGVIVCRSSKSWEPVFWPQNLEYANCTFFINEDDFESNQQCQTIIGTFDEVAMMTDGLQGVALDNSIQAGHPGFFNPLFARLIDGTDMALLRQPFRALLESSIMNERTDDDKTLILAKRVKPSVNSTC